MAHKWVHSSAYSSIPPNAVVGGNDTDGSVIYVGRSFHNGDMLVAKVLPSKHIAFVSWRGEEIPKYHFEILCGRNLAWRQCYDHVIPENAVLCGKTNLEQPVYIGRGHYEKSLTIGKVSSVHRALFIPFKGAERRLECYEILVEDLQPVGWSITSPSLPLPPPPSPPPPLPIYEKPYPLPLESKPPLYAAMPQPPSFGTAPPIFPCALKEPPPPYLPSQSYIPPPLTYTPQPTYEPKPQRSHDIWMVANSEYIPPNCVQSGHDVDLSVILVCRAFHEGQIIPGKVITYHSSAFISFEGREISKYNFEVLLDSHNYLWVPSREGNIAPGAVQAGRTATGEPLYIGRGHYGNTLTPGKIQRSHRCLYIAFGGRELPITNYEVLVRKDEFYRAQSMQMHY